MADVCQNNHGGNALSIAAHDSIEPTKLALQLYVLDFIRARPSTCDEIERLTGLKHQTASARFTELKAAGLIRAVGKRPTSSGRLAAVYEAV
jgi:hypothetical protein